MNKDVLRSKKTLGLYHTHRLRLGESTNHVDLTCLPAVQKFKYWVLVENEFPYDKIAGRHDLLVPLREFQDDNEMNKKEREELFKIKEQFTTNEEFDTIFENLAHKRTVPGHYHLHCIKYLYITPIKDLS